MRKLTFILRSIPAIFIWIYSIGSSFAQVCPPNIDFEQGSFANWQCYKGYSNNVLNIAPVAIPDTGLHVMYSSTPGNGLDKFGNFPKNCPNGSGHSIRLGNDIGDGSAQGVSYDVVIPPGDGFYSFTYYYAVVLEQHPVVLPGDQPEMIVDVRDLTTNTVDNCSSIAYFLTGTPLSGFELSALAPQGSPVWYKKWTAASLTLRGNVGDTFRIFFKTTDCTYGAHFAYAYIDVNSQCSNKLEGAVYCPDDSAVTLKAPYGFASYQWTTNAFTQVLGSGQTLTLHPPPPTPLSVAVVMQPYFGVGCVDTMYAELKDTLSSHANAGPDRVSCNQEAMQLGEPPSPGWTYQWTPATGLNDPNISNPLANPNITTSYLLKVNHDAGGCRSSDTVNVVADQINDMISNLGKDAWCIGSGDSTVLSVQPADNIQWYKDEVAIPGAIQAILHITQSGTFKALLHNNTGCTLFTVSKQIDIASVPVASFVVDKTIQCRLGNKFIFTNNSSNAVGAMHFKWDFGDGKVDTTRDAVHTYTQAGSFKVVMTVSSNAACSDSSVIRVTVFENVVADFTINKSCVNVPVQLVNTTIDPATSPLHYLWDLGNGITSTQKDPPPLIYSSAGSYMVTLGVYSDQCPHPVNTLKRFAFVDAPKPASNYPVQIAVENLPLKLAARNIGDNILWKPAFNLDDPFSYSPVFRGNTEQLYTIELRTNSGCITVDTQLVKVHPNVEIFVPNTFTPNNDGVNDELKPYPIGLKTLNYFRVFNRWGQLVFETHQLGRGWDGRFRGIPLEMQSFIWEVEGVGADDVVYRKKGSSILIR